MISLHALYMQILYGDVDLAEEKKRQLVDNKVMEEWKTLKGMKREQLYVKFALELAVRME